MRLFRSRTFWVVCLCGLAGVLVDIDHVISYVFFPQLLQQDDTLGRFLHTPIALGSGIVLFLAGACVLGFCISLFLRDTSVNKAKINYWLVAGIGAIVLAAFCIRVIPLWTDVFTQNGVMFLGVDSWYQMRLVDNMAANFPRPLWFDAYALYPDGAATGYRPVLPWLVAGTSYLLSLGHPSQALLDTVGAFMPAVLGSLLVIPVYILGKELFNRTTGVVAAIFAALWPSELLHRSLLGFTDHHIIEVFFATLTIMFLVLGIKRGRIQYGVVAGVCLGIYLWNWHGALLLAGILGLWYLVWFMYNYVKHPGENYLADSAWKVTAACFGMGFFVFLPGIHYTLSPQLFLFPLLTLAALPPLLTLGAQYTKSRRLFIGVAIALPLAAVGLLKLLSPETATLVVSELRGIFWGFGTTISEARPMVPSLLVTIYGLGIVGMVGGLVLAIKHKANLLFLVWTAVMILALFGQRRWGYYATVNIALLSGYFVAWLVHYIEQSWRSWLVGVVICAMVLSVGPGMLQMSRATPNINEDWYRATVWLRENTPEPFNQGTYTFGDGHSADSPYFAYYCVKTEERPDYAVLSWWDYGHWIIRIAKRVPISSPTQQEVEVGWAFFIAQSVEEAEAAIGDKNIRYIVISQDMIDGKFYAMVLKSGGHEMNLGFWQSSIGYRLFYGTESVGDALGPYRLIADFNTVKVFERGNEG